MVSVRFRTTATLTRGPNFILLRSSKCCVVFTLRKCSMNSSTAGRCRALPRHTGWLDAAGSSFSVDTSRFVGVGCDVGLGGSDMTSRGSSLTSPLSWRSPACAAPSFRRGRFRCDERTLTRLRFPCEALPASGRFPCEALSASGSSSCLSTSSSCRVEELSKVRPRVLSPGSKVVRDDDAGNLEPVKFVVDDCAEP